MSGEDGFLTRWSRRKQDARTAPTPEPPAPAADAPRQTPEIDLASLPALETLTAETPLAPFLQKGVPEAVKNAALRRMWEMDPAIRDYIGPADYQWDFHTPGALEGFGDLDPGLDISKMVADVTEFHLKPPPAQPVAQEGEEDPALPARQDESPDAIAQHAEDEGLSEPLEPTVAPEAALLPPRRRRHGGGTPS